MHPPSLWYLLRGRGEGANHVPARMQLTRKHVELLTAAHTLKQIALAPTLINIQTGQMLTEPAP